MNQKRPSKQLLGLGFAALGAFSLALQAEPPPPANNVAAPMAAHKHGDKARHKMMHKGLDLSKEQKKQMRDMKQAMKPKMKDIMNNLTKIRQELRSLTISASYSDEKARALANRQGQLVADLFFMQSKMQHQFFQILTKEQRDRLQSMAAPKGGPKPPPKP
jgi:Spy/CpxP family protein refolding chaperone